MRLLIFYEMRDCFLYYVDYLFTDVILMKIFRWDWLCNRCCLRVKLEYNNLKKNILIKYKLI